MSRNICTFAVSLKGQSSLVNKQRGVLKAIRKMELGMGGSMSVKISTHIQKI